MFSIIFPCEANRVPLLRYTVKTYLDYGIPEGTEFIIVSRTIKNYPFCKVINYEWNEPTFNPAMAFNIGIKNAKNDRIVITSPEVKPTTDVLKQFSELPLGNYLGQVFDQNEDTTVGMSLVNKNFRGDTAAMYWLACFNKQDLIDINGWDEDFMYGYAYDDDDFGARFKRGGKTFEIKEEIQGIHQWHKRCSASGNDTVDLKHNRELFNKNNLEGVVRPKNGLVKE